ncbi:aminotransferase class V-fold PLP-dependent enzyme [Streptomyces sp. NPDC046939]|uniref:aminotransferase class V-fold PLP-dependent enzyme n=1 Tax=Streptomyces sp. NPDC046939 TaxID=3155376 RepID=UPI0033E86397
MQTTDETTRDQQPDVPALDLPPEPALDLDLVRAQYHPDATYLNTAGFGVLPARAADAVRIAVDTMAAGRPLDALFADVEEARASFARIAGVPVARVAAGASVAVYGGLVAASLPPGAEVLTAENDFSSTVNPFHVRGDLRVRVVPLDTLAESVRPGTALVAVSAAQSADGRVADLAALREATRAHGARLYVDASQAAGWYPLDEHAADADYVSAVAYKWLSCPRGTAFFVGPEDPDELRPVFGGYVSGEVPMDSCYGPVTEPARSGRRFDEAPSLLAYTAARQSLALIEELGTAAVRAHDLALADRFRTGLAALGHTPVPSPGSPIVSVPRLGAKAAEMRADGIEVADRAGHLRAAFHLYNTPEDVDRLLAALSH